MSVIQANDKSFEQQLATHEKVVVKYYAGWCGSCRLFEPKFKRLSAEERFQDVAFLDVNTEMSPEARKTGKVKQLPTFAIFKNGSLVESLATNKEELVVELIQKLN